MDCDGGVGEFTGVLWRVLFISFVLFNLLGSAKLGVWDTSSYDILSYIFGWDHITMAFMVIIYPGQVHLHQPASISRDSLYCCFPLG